MMFVWYILCEICGDVACGGDKLETIFIAVFVASFSSWLMAVMQLSHGSFATSASFSSVVFLLAGDGFPMSSGVVMVLWLCSRHT